jgi:uncharacterized protein (UPF0179 family)
MALVSLIGEKIAEKDLEFIYLGPLNECKDCKLKNICFNLKPFHRYKISNVRNKRHSCSVHKGDVVVVEVEQQLIRTAIDKKFSKGSSTQLPLNECDDVFCDNYELCSNPAILKNKKYKIMNVISDIDCPRDLNLQEVELSE